MPLTDPQHFADRAVHRRRRIVRLLLASNLIVGIVLASLVYLVLTASRDSYSRQAKDVAEGMAAIAQASIASELDQVDAVMRATESELLRVMAAGHTDDATLQGVLQSNFKLLKGVEALRMTDAVGKVRWGTALPAGAPTSVADRDYFKTGMQYVAGDTLVAGPLKSRVSGNWVIGFMRPLRIDGNFRGLLYVSVGADYFNQLFQRYDLADQDAITLRNNQLELIARRAPGSSTQGEVGSKAVSETLRAAVTARPQQGTFVAKVVLDGIDRTNAYRKVDRWPFTVYAGIAHTRFFNCLAAGHARVGSGRRRLDRPLPGQRAGMARRPGVERADTPHPDLVADRRRWHPHRRSHRPPRRDERFVRGDAALFAREPARAPCLVVGREPGRNQDLGLAREGQGR
jgi:hypothetical protein